MTPSEDEHFDAKVTDICDLYRDAPALVQSGDRVMSTDELTGVQALERKHPGLPLAPGKVERREFEYIRHGTRSFIISRDVVTGQIVEPYGGPRRTEADFLQHVEAVIASDRVAQRWHFVVDNLDTHRSESLAGCGKTLLSTQGRKLSDDKRRPIACSERIIRIGLSHAECRRDS